MSHISSAVANKLSGIAISTEDPTELFTLQERLGKGSFGEVFKAVGKTNKFVGTVAIKIVTIDADEGLADVRHEIQILAECNHPNIVSYLGSYYRDNNLWVLQSFCSIN